MEKFRTFTAEEFTKMWFVPPYDDIVFAKSLFGNKKEMSVFDFLDLNVSDTDKVSVLVEGDATFVDRSIIKDWVRKIVEKEVVEHLLFSGFPEVTQWASKFLYNENLIKDINSDKDFENAYSMVHDVIWNGDSHETDLSNVCCDMWLFKIYNTLNITSDYMLGWYWTAVSKVYDNYGGFCDVISEKLVVMFREVLLHTGDLSAKEILQLNIKDKDKVYFLTIKKLLPEDILCEWSKEVLKEGVVEFLCHSGIDEITNYANSWIAGCSPENDRESHLIAMGKIIENCKNVENGGTNKRYRMFETLDAMFFHDSGEWYKSISSSPYTMVHGSHKESARQLRILIDLLKKMNFSVF